MKKELVKDIYNELLNNLGYFKGYSPFIDGDGISHDIRGVKTKNQRVIYPTLLKVGKNFWGDDAFRFQLPKAKFSKALKDAVVEVSRANRCKIKIVLTDTKFDEIPLVRYTAKFICKGGC